MFCCSSRNVELGLEATADPDGTVMLVGAVTMEVVLSSNGITTTSVMIGIGISSSIPSFIVIVNSDLKTRYDFL